MENQDKLIEKEITATSDEYIKASTDFIMFLNKNIGVVSEANCVEVAKKLNDIYQIAFKTGVNAGIVGYEQKLREYFAKYAEKDSSGYIKLLANILTECFEGMKNDDKRTEQ